MEKRERERDIERVSDREKDRERELETQILGSEVFDVNHRVMRHHYQLLSFKLNFIVTLLSNTPSVSINHRFIVS